MTVSEWVFGSGPAAEVGTGATVEVFELAFEAEGGSELDVGAESGSIAENEAGAEVRAEVQAESGGEAEDEGVNEAEVGVESGAEVGDEVVDEPGDEVGDKAEAAEAGPEPRSAAEFDLVVSEHDTCHNLSSEVVVAWNSGVSPSLEVVVEPRVVVVFVVACQADGTVAPCEDTKVALSEILTGIQLGATVVELEQLDKPETVGLDLLAEGMVGESGASAGQRLDFAALVWVPTAEQETDPVGNPESSVEVVL